MKEVLTQNDFISRLLNLINDDGDSANPLFLTSVLLLQNLTNLKENFNKVRVIKERYNVALIVLINNKYALVIDDKILENAKEVYTDIIKHIYIKNFSDDNLICIYYNIKNETPEITEPYRIYTREEFIKILNRYKKDITSLIYNDYLSFLTSIEEDKKIDISKSISEWSYRAIGNIFNLSNTTPKASEDIVDKLGFEWNGIYINNIIFYWQIEYSLEESTLMVVLKMNYERSNDIEYISEKKLYAQFFMLVRFGNDFIPYPNDVEGFHSNIGYIKFDYINYENIFKKCLEELNLLERYILD
jgi:hypothetical protein